MAGALTLAACDRDSPVGARPPELREGTWGGDDAGVIVSAAVAHVHVGCTYGDFPAPVELDADQRFSVAGEYLLRAYPVALGPTLPAQFAGVVRGGALTLSVAVNDTIEHQLTVLGPVTVRFGTEPGLDQCPICSSPAPARPARVRPARARADGARWADIQSPRATSRALRATHVHPVEVLLPD